MANWLRNLFHGNDDEPLEDFVLYSDNNTNPEAPVAPTAGAEPPVSPAAPESPSGDFASATPDYDESAMYETTRLGDISSHITNTTTDEAEEAPTSFFKKNKKILLRVGVPIIALFLVAALILTIPVITDPLRGYARASVSRGNVISSLNVSGTLSANAHYTITSTVSGTVMDAPVELGERVEAGTVLYQLDDADAQLALQRAENQLEKSKAVGSYNTAPLRIYASEAGVIQSLTIQNGQSVSAGQIIGTLKRDDDSVVTLTSSVSGTVSSVNVRHGSSVSAGSVIASVKDTKAELDQKASQYDQKNDEIDIAVAENQLNRYTIVSPVSGVVTEKNAKVGDNVAMTDTKNPMMVITDTSSMRFTTQIEEAKIAEIRPGLRTSVTTDSVPNKTFTGKISSVSPEGSRNKDGKLVFDVEISVENPGTLKTGMNVSAKVILATANNTLHIPKKALRNPDGKSAVVLVKNKANQAKKSPSASSVKKAKKANIEIPKGCRLATVQYGISDGTNVQILSGLKRGEVVVYLPEWEAPDLKVAPADDKQGNGVITTTPGGSSSSGSYTPGNSGTVSRPATSSSSATTGSTSRSGSSAPVETASPEEVEMIRKLLEESSQ